MVMLAVTSHGQALALASSALRANVHVVTAAVNEDRRAMKAAKVSKEVRATLVRAGPKETRFLFGHMPYPFDLPTELLETHILPRVHIAGKRERRTCVTRSVAFAHA